MKRPSFVFSILLAACLPSVSAIVTYGGLTFEGEKPEPVSHTLGNLSISISEDAKSLDEDRKLLRVKGATGGIFSEAGRLYYKVVIGLTLLNDGGTPSTKWYSQGGGKKIEKYLDFSIQFSGLPSSISTGAFDVYAIGDFDYAKRMFWAERTNLADSISCSLYTYDHFSNVDYDRDSVYSLIQEAINSDPTMGAKALDFSVVYSVSLESKEAGDAIQALTFSAEVSD